MLELPKEAKAVWIAFHDDVEMELKPGRDMDEAKDVASKAADNAARLATLTPGIYTRQHDSLEKFPYLWKK